MQNTTDTQNYLLINDSVVSRLQEAIETIGDWAEKKGWNEDIIQLADASNSDIQKENYARVLLMYKMSKISLMNTETAELAEGLRHGNPPDSHVPSLSSEAAELADLVIRIFHYADEFAVPLAEAIAVKHKYNCGRPARHGKLC